jgi:ribonuclease HI
MELLAVIKALEIIKQTSDIKIYTDSTYVQKGITEWIHAWKRNHWKNSSKKIIKNIDLWQRLDELASGHTIEWLWVKGHAGLDGNEKADQLANLGIDYLFKDSL